MEQPTTRNSQWGEEQEEDEEHSYWDRHFNPYRKAYSLRAKAFVQQVLSEVLAWEAQHCPRTRSRRPADLQNLEQQLDNLLANLVHTHLTQPGRSIAISRRHENLGSTSRYKPSHITNGLRQSTALLDGEALGYLQFIKGVWSSKGNSSKRSTIDPTGKLILTIGQRSLGIEDYCLDDGAETIILKSPKIKGTSSLMDYQETPETLAMREEMYVINDWLSKADLQYHTDGTEPGLVDTQDRKLHRVFCNGSFRELGRLYGAFWISLTKTQRRKNLRINGNRVIALDYKSMIARTLYGLVQVVPTFEDAYAIPDYERHRDGVKEVFSSLVYRSTPLTKLPQGTVSKLPKGTKAFDLVAKLSALHRPIAQFFCQSIGLKAACTESKILLGVLNDLKAKDIIALPIHDCIVVEEKHQDTAKATMEQVFMETLGIPGLVSIE